MILVEVDFLDQTVTVSSQFAQNQTCTFLESGLAPNGINLGPNDLETIEDHFQDRYEEEGEEVNIKFIGDNLRGSLAAELSNLDQSNYTEPAAQIWVDDRGNIFWVTPSKKFLWIGEDDNFYIYVDNKHEIISIDYAPEGVGSTGVFWDNLDFENPFHVSDFEDQIQHVTI